MACLVFILLSVVCHLMVKYINRKLRCWSDSTIFDVRPESWSLIFVIGTNTMRRIRNLSRIIMKVCIHALIWQTKLLVITLGNTLWSITFLGSQNMELGKHIGTPNDESNEFLMCPPQQTGINLMEHEAVLFTVQQCCKTALLFT